MNLDSIIIKTQALLESQDYAIICTGENNNYHGALVGYLYDKLHEAIYFASANYTRKSEYLSRDNKVALVIDNRSENPKVSNIECVTVNGSTSLIIEAKLKSETQKALLTKHPYLKELYLSTSCQFYKVKITHYQHVTHLQQVLKWQI